LLSSPFFCYDILIISSINRQDAFSPIDAAVPISTYIIAYLGKYASLKLLIITELGDQNDANFSFFTQIIFIALTLWTV